MASLRFVALALAVCLFGVFIPSSSAHAAPKKATAAKKTANRNASLVKTMQSRGFSASKARSVIAALTRYETDYRRVHKDMTKARAALRDKSTANDKAARARIAADQKQLNRVHKRYKSEISRTLTAAERNKLAQIFGPPKPKGKAKGKGKAKAKGKASKKKKPKQSPKKKS
jgi:hypothetical protein